MLKRTAITRTKGISIRFKILSLLLLSVFVIIGTNFFALSNYKQDLADQLRTSMEQTLAGNIKLLNQTVQNHINSLQTFADLDVLKDEDKEAALDYLKKEILHQQSLPGNWFESFGLIELDGSAINTDDAPVNLGERDYFKYIVNGGEIAFSSPTISKVSGKIAIMMAVPIKKQGKLVRVLYTRLDLGQLSQQITATKYGKKGRAYLTDAKGVTIAHPDEKLLLKNLTQVGGPITKEVAQRTQKMVDTKMGQIEYTFEGVNSIASYQAIPLTGWILAIVADRDEVFAQVDASARNLTVIAVVSSLLLLLFGVYLANKIVKPISQLVSAAGNLAEGQLTEEIVIKTQDEVGLLAKSFEEMRKNLKELIGSIVTATDHVNETVSALSAQAEQTTAAATANASTVSEVASTVDNIVGNIKEVSDNLEEASIQAGQGKDQVNQVVTTIGEISQSTDEVARTIVTLNQAIAEIGKFVETIDAIAGQTNLLALNAAIEAARAGDAGRGFAVVADEVRKLAENSANSAVEITKIITNIQQQSNQATAAMHTGQQRVTRGSQVVQEVSESLVSIIDLIESLNERAHEVATAASQVSGAVQNVAATTEEQTASMEEVSASASELNGTAEALQKMIRRFKI